MRNAFIRRRSLLSLLAVVAVVPLLSGQSCKTAKRTVIDGGVFISSDRGDTWKDANFVRQDDERRLTIADVSVITMQFDPDEPKRFFIGTRDNGLWRSVNAAESWEQIGPTATANVPAFSLNPQDQNTLFAVSGTGIYRTTDGGVAWERVYTDARGRPIADVDIDGFNPTKVFALIGNELLLSIDGGTTWSIAEQYSFQPRELHINPLDTRIQYIVTTKGELMKTDDQWLGVINVTTSSLSVFKQNRVVDFHMVPQRPNVLVLSTRQGILRSTDQGASWNEYPTLYPSGAFPATLVTVNPRNIDEFYYVVNARVIHHSEDAGKNWRTLSTFPSTRTITALGIEPEGEGRIIAATLLPPKD